MMKISYSLIPYPLNHAPQVTLDAGTIRLDFTPLPLLHDLLQLFPSPSSLAHLQDPSYHKLKCFQPSPVQLSSCLDESQIIIQPFLISSLHLLSAIPVCSYPQEVLIDDRCMLDPFVFLDIAVMFFEL